MPQISFDGSTREAGGAMASRTNEVAMGVGRPMLAQLGPRLVSFEPITLWVLGFASAAILAVYYAWFAHLTQMDFQVYRMGGQHVFGSGLYSSHITLLGRHLLFTYPPIAAALFWPLSRVYVYD